MVEGDRAPQARKALLAGHRPVVNAAQRNPVFYGSLERRRAFVEMPELQGELIHLVRPDFRVRHENPAQKQRNC